MGYLFHDAKICHILLCCICLTVLLCLPKTVDWSNKNAEWPIARQEKDRRGCQAERLDRRSKREGGARKEGEEDARGQPCSNTATRGERKKI